jgi:hypothetical protein
MRILIVNSMSTETILCCTENTPDTDRFKFLHPQKDINVIIPISLVYIKSIEIMDVKC